LQEPKRIPERLACFTSLALGDPHAAATELERRVSKLRSVGGFLNGTEGGSFLDDLLYTPIFEAAEALDIPLYLHPTPPPATIRDAYFSGLPENSAYFLYGGLGMARGTGNALPQTHTLWTFRPLPEAQDIIGHRGEDLPFSLLRAQDGLPQSVTHLQRSIFGVFPRPFLRDNQRLLHAATVLLRYGCARR
jgi:predicted TIM-barrel fold metal-dependent hydrolase